MPKKNRMKNRGRKHHLANKNFLKQETTLGVIQTRSQKHRSPNAPTLENFIEGAASMEESKDDDEETRKNEKKKKKRKNEMMTR